MKIIRIVLLALIAIPCWAQTRNIPVSSVSQIIGCWERIDFSENVKKKMNQFEPWPIRFQWFCFDPDGIYSMYGSSQPQTLTSAELREMFRRLPKEFSYSLLPNGIIKTEARSGRETLFSDSAFMGNSYSFDHKIIEKGTLIMALVDRRGNKDKVVYYRYLKRVP